jgi:hypothetical protein
MKEILDKISKEKIFRKSDRVLKWDAKREEK